MAEWPESRQLAALYQSPGPAGIGFAQYASSGTVTPELWQNIAYIAAEAERRPNDPAVEGWAYDMEKLRDLLREEGIFELEGTQWSHADRAKAALLEYQYEVTGDHYAGDEGSDEFDEAVIGLLTDLKHLLWRAGGAAYALEDLTQTAIDRWSAECEKLPEGGDEEEGDD